MNHELVRSTTHLLGFFPSSLSFFSSPRERICAIYPFSLQASSDGLPKYPLSKQIFSWVFSFLPDLVRFVAQIKEAGAGFRSLTESIDTTTAAGILTFHVFCALADFERALLLERTSAGIKAAQARGKSCGRPFALTPEQVDLAIQRVNEHHGVADTAKLLGVSPRTLQRAMRRRNEPDKRRRRVA